MRKAGFTEGMIFKCKNGDKSEFKNEPPLNQFKEHMHELGWDDECINGVLKTAEDLAPLQDNIVWLKPYLTKHYDSGVQA